MPFQIGLSGLHAATADLKVTGNNLANAKTTGFKRSRAEFVDIYGQAYGSISQTAIGSGARLNNVAQNFSQGDPTYTDYALDLAIDGQGFFVLDDCGVQKFTRDGSFHVSNSGHIENANGQRLQAYPTAKGFAGCSADDEQDCAGNGFNVGQLQDIKLDYTQGEPKPTGEVEGNLNLPSDVEPIRTADTNGDGVIDENDDVDAFDVDDPDTYYQSTGITIYDSLGTPRTLTMYFRKTENAGEWEVYTDLDGESQTGPETITFNSNGQVTGTPEFELDYTGSGPNGDGIQENGATLGPLDPTQTPPVGTGIVKVDLLKMTQFGTQFAVNDFGQDGYTSGKLAGFEVNRNGVIFARFTNNRAKALGQVAMANFRNPHGLLQLGNNDWAQSCNSGEPVMNAPGSSNLGEVISGALESSNVNVADELVNMIVAQRNYEANAKTISTADQMTQTIINMR